MPFTTLSNFEQNGELKVDATHHADLPGLKNNTSKELRISFTATGTWCLYNVPSTDPALAVFNAQTDWKGYQLPKAIYDNHQWRQAGAPAGALLVELLDPQNAVKTVLASPASVDVPPGWSVAFVVNDDPVWYANNSGQITLKYQSKAKEPVSLPRLKGGNPLIKGFCDTARNTINVDLNVPINCDGLVTSFQIFACYLDSIQLIIYRRLANKMVVVGSSPIVDPKQAGVNEFPLEKGIVVKAGDLVGFYYPNGAVIAFTVIGGGNPGWRADLSGKVLWKHNTSVADTQINAETNFQMSDNRIYAIAVSGPAS